MASSLHELQSQMQKVNQLLETIARDWETSAYDRKYEELYTLSQEASKVAFYAACLHGALKRQELEA